VSGHRGMPAFTPWAGHAWLQDLPPGPPARTPSVLFEGESLLLFHGAMVSMMMLIPPNTLSISLCTRRTSDFRKSCIRWSSDAKPSSSWTELDANRATEDLIRSEPASVLVATFGFCRSTKSLAVASTGIDFSTAVADVGAFIASPYWGMVQFIPNPNDIFSPVNIQCFGRLVQL
jgi:hypothetical protein